ncbi:hypothetical protein QWI17_02395 [Gilvimarinus sp. SDUM040013]|uniref:Hydrazine synthase alpha subunit middle domain-containing protein n=1 Tax=Gilvimarinus gilvus TaxID=3058038 RepID=A0ABU4S393_9GAMM|nr:hypothetical protein [Gilvimarinus sp. SDUM040013]MDO3384682.1 hypothetical protein [Gilvimarinus sp. SDUM040013]MDX6850268.1 hypothetical protein [Gilvimarinus sp. SDUM040013]
MTTPSRQLRWRALPLALATALGLAACGGGGGGGLSGGGQEPDPVVVDLPIAYIERALPRDEAGELLPPEPFRRSDFNPGAQLFLKERATDDALTINISDEAFAGGEYDVKDLSAHPDGDRLLFAMRAPELEDVDEDDQPNWNIWEYNLELGELRRVISSDIVAEQADDINPRYLPDGRIVFSSTRQIRSRAILLDDDKAQYAAESESGDGPAFVLHSMNDDGSDIHQLSYNQSHEWEPLLLADGRLLFTRSDNYNNNRISYYTARPDGTDLRRHYGFYTLLGEETPWLFNPELMPDGRLVGIYKPRESLLGGDLVAINHTDYVESNRSIASVSEDDTEADAAALDTLTVLPVMIDGSVSRHGEFSALAPLYDGTNRLLVSWSQCRLIEPANPEVDGSEERYVPCTEANLALEEPLEPAPPVYGLWLYNLDDNLQQPVIVPKEDVYYTDLVTLEPRAPVEYLAPDVDPDLAEEGVGVLHISSVYDMDGEDSSNAGYNNLRDPAQFTAAERPARFLRLLKAVSLPPDDILDFPGSAFGFSGGQRFKEILGYVPIEPDGSVKTLVPADVAFTVSIVDANGQRISDRHEHWLQVRPGETFECQGCHQDGSPIPHGRTNAGPQKLNTGATTTGVPFPNTEPALFADMGETMAEVYARIAGIRTPSVDIEYTDDWTDPAVRAKDESFSYRYAAIYDTPDPTKLPASELCQQSWSAECRTVIHYPEHIQPLWEKPRVVLDDAGAILADNTCTSCHNTVDVDGLVQVPAGQLDLTATENNSPHITSYRKLLATHFEQEVVEGVLQDVLIESGEFERDEEGELILDAEGNPIPILVRVPVGRLMTPAGAIFSGRFFNRMNQFDQEDATFDHRGLLNASEQKLISEWLDIGAQYYNDPFDVPD